jgi:hypothetical protein
VEILTFSGLMECATHCECQASHFKQVITLTTTLQLLKAKRSSALKDARKMEAQLASLNKEAEAAGIATNLRCIVRMFREHIATLDEAIRSAHTPRDRKNGGLSV